MRIHCLNQTLICSFLSMSLGFPAYAALDRNNYPVVISFSSDNDAKQMVQSSYSTLTDLNRALMTLNKYVIRSLGTGTFSEDQIFQNKKNKITRILNKQKCTLHIFREQEINIDFYNSTNDKHYEIRIPILAASELGLNNTHINRVDNAKEALKALSVADQKLVSLLTPKEVSASNVDEKPHKLNMLKIKHPESYRAITNSLKQALTFYRTILSRMGECADKSASGKYSEKQMEDLDTEYRYLVNELSRTIKFSDQTINLLKIFNGNELILNVHNPIQKKYYMPELSLSILELENDSIYDFNSSIKSYDDIEAAMRWILDWNITGQEAFNVASD